MKSKDELCDGTWFLLRVGYPCAQDAADYYLVQSEDGSEPVLDEDTESQLIQDVIDQYGYDDEPNIDDYESEDTYNDEYNNWLESTKENCSIEFEPITPVLINSYGYEWIANTSIL